RRAYLNNKKSPRPGKGREPSSRGTTLVPACSERRPAPLPATHGSPCRGNAPQARRRRLGTPGLTFGARLGMGYPRRFPARLAPTRARCAVQAPLTRLRHSLWLSAHHTIVWRLVQLGAALTPPLHSPPPSPTRARSPSVRRRVG